MTDASPAATTDEPEHRASWLELFFDLVVVVAIATLAQRLEEHADGTALARVLIMYLAIWLVWTSFMLYANVAGDKTHRRAMLLAMGCIAVMAAAVPLADEFGRGRVFAIAYIAARVIAGGTWRDTQQVLIDWPIAQLSIGLTPWLASIWVGDPARYYLWAGGLALDVVYAVWSTRNADLVLERVRQDDDRAKRSRRRRSRAERRGRKAPPQREVVTYQAAEVNQSHFGERLGTFTIIVLGEAVTQIVTASGSSDWNSRFDVAAVAAFLFLFGLWWLTFQYSSYTEQGSKADALPIHISLPLHFLTTTAIMLMAVGLGEAVRDSEHPLGTGVRWILAGGLSAYLLVTQSAVAFTRRLATWWIFLMGLILIAAPLVLAGVGAEMPGWVMAPALALVVGGQVVFRRLDIELTARLVNESS